MKIEFGFWQYKEGAPRDNDGGVYKAACHGRKHLDELEIIPIDEIWKMIANSFSDWSKEYGSSIFVKEGCGVFSVYTTAQSVRIDCYDLDKSIVDLLIKILHEFNCPLYDPQECARFDSWTTK